MENINFIDNKDGIMTFAFTVNLIKMTCVYVVKHFNSFLFGNDLFIDKKRANDFDLKNHLNSILKLQFFTLTLLINAFFFFFFR